MKINFITRLLHKKLRNLRVPGRMEGLPKAVQRTVVCGEGIVRFGRNVLVGWKQSPMLRMTEGYFEARYPGSIIEICDGCIFNNGASLIAAERITIGKRCVFGTMLRIFDSDFHGLTIKDRNNPAAIANKPVEIGDDCWCGDGVTILKGVKLGSGCVVGAGSMVTKSFPPNSLITGNPARLVREIKQTCAESNTNPALNMKDNR